MRAPSRRSRWRGAAAAGLTALALTGLAACGSSSSGSVGSLLGNSGSSAGPIGSSSSSDSGGSTTTHQPGDSITTSEAVDITKKAMSSMTTAHVTMDMSVTSSGQSVSMKGDGDMQMSPLAEDLTMTVDQLGEIHMILTDGTMYMQMPSSAGMGDKWIKLDMSDLSSFGMSGASDAFTNPMSMIDKFSAAITGATYVGSDSTGQHYSFTIDAAKVMSAFGSAADSSTAQLPSSVTEEMWLDDQGRMVQSKVDMGSMGDVTMNMSDFGKSVSIQAPPESDTTSMPTP